MEPWRMAAALALGTALGCAAQTTDPAAAERDATLGRAPNAPVTTFAGAWRSVTPSLEFVRLSVVSLSREPGAIAARLTLSGVALDGDARIEGDSLVAALSYGGAPANRRLVARARDARTLLVQLRSPDAAPLALTFVRED
jgi:hypothetical protein